MTLSATMSPGMRLDPVTVSYRVRSIIVRPEKANIVSDLAEELNRSPFVLVTDYQRMNVNRFQRIAKSARRQAGAECTWSKTVS